MTLPPAEVSETDAVTAPGPLDGVVIADFSRVLAGPYCSMLLADLGATVIKVESPAGDETRAYKPPTLGDDSTYYLSVNRNKRSIMLDLTDAADRAAAQQLAQRADVVIQNFKPGGAARFGLDYEAVSKTNPSVVYASISGFGTEPAAAGLLGYDLLIQALSGMMDVTGTPDAPPLRAGLSMFDVITGLHSAIGILAALHHRERAGEGQHVEMSLLMSALSGMVNLTGAYVMTGAVPRRMGNEHPSLYPYAPFDTRQGQLILAIGNDHQFRRLCRAVGLPDLADDPRFATAPARSAHRDALRPLLTRALLQRTADEWFEVLARDSIPAAPIQDVAGGLATATRLGLQPTVRSGTGDEALPGIRNPITFSATPASYRYRPPGIGEHSEEILAWLRAGTSGPHLTESDQQ
jgi:crotonobetainyl-CoA:carnitine CoA-transferase CaiB-like acyl-CoA transferase